MASYPITKQSSSLVLAGRSGGVTVVPKPTPLTRLHYFDGKFLRASDLELEQRYLRNLVALSNQAGGAGVVHGFDCTLAGDQLQVGAGLAIDPQGRALLLPEGRTVSLAELIEASRQSGALSLNATRRDAGRVAFGTCEELAAADAGGVSAVSSLYLITLFHAEALCGEEDVFGKLCAEACATSTERPYVLEGVLLRAVPYTLATALATSRAVALTARHLRSLTASACFEDERRRVASLISGDGLASDAWCLGAEAAGGAGVPIAMVSRAGTVTRFFDAWAARRERIEAPARRYWAGRMAMRPWDVFLAQILQFQCQLTDCLGDHGGDSDADDPCRQAWDLLRETARRLGRMIEGAATEMSAERNTTASELPLAYRDLDELRGRLSDAAATVAAVPRERRLIACGIVELPSAGYLPVTAGSTVSVNDQVRAWMGEGVDLRFCAVRPDFVPHALEEAQHMERISLLAGLDHPEEKPQVDILVPDGELLAAGLPVGAGYVVDTGLDAALFALLSRLTEEEEKSGTAAGATSASLRTAITKSAARPAMLSVSGAGRSGTTPAGGTALYLAGGTARSLGSSSSKANPAHWVMESQAQARRVKEETGEAALTMKTEEAGREDQAQERSKLLARLLEVRQKEDSAAAELQGITGEVWARLETDRDVFTLARGGRARVTGELALAARRGEEAASVRCDLAGDLAITRREERDGGVQLAAVFRGTFDIDGSDNGMAGSRRYKASQSLILTRAAGAGDGGSVRLVSGLHLWWSERILDLVAEMHFTAPGHASLAVGVAFPQEQLPLAFAEAERDDRVALPAHRAHETSVSALRSLAAVFRDPDFDDLRARLLFPTDSPDTAELRLRAVHDWVLFHRRRTKNCGDIPAPTRTVPRRYQVLHLALSDVRQRDVLIGVLRAGGSLAGFPMEDLAEVTFGGGVAAIEEPSLDQLQRRWRAVAPAGSELGLAVIASRDAAAGDGRALAENRLGALTNSLDDVTPLHEDIEVGVLPGVPADLEAGDADGVIILAVIKAAVTCQEVYVAAERQLPEDTIKAFAEIIRVSGLFPDVARRLNLRLLGDPVSFADDQLETESRDELREKWKALQDERKDLFKGAVPVALVVSEPGAAEEEQAGHWKQGEAIFTALSSAAGEVLNNVVNGGNLFSVKCPAVTLILLRIEQG